MIKYILAHRGVKTNYKDNTFNSLCEIKKYSNSNIATNNIGFGIEFDVNMTSDNVLILSHDEYIEGCDKKIIDMTCDEVKSANNEICLLEDILNEFIETEYLLDIELKEYPEDKKVFCNTFIKLVEKYKNKINWFVSSFNKEIVNYLTEFGIETYLLVERNEMSNIDNNKNKLVVHCSDLNNENINVKGVYTLYEDNFDEKYLNKINEVKFLITDDVEKLLEYIQIINFFIPPQV